MSIMHLVLLLLGLGAWLGSAAPVGAQASQKLLLSDMVSKADNIFVGTVTEVKPTVKGGNIVTEYKIKPSEQWKGQLPVDGNGEIRMAELGGKLNGALPIAQKAAGAAEFANGEEVLLFTRERKAAGLQAAGKSTAAATASRGSIAIVGRQQGRFTVLRHPENGTRLVARANVGAMPSSPLSAAIKREAENQPAGAAVTAASASAAGPVTPLQKQAQKSGQMAQASRAVSERITRLAEHHEATREQVAKHQPGAQDEIYDLEGLNEVKARVLKLVKTGK